MRKIPRKEQSMVNSIKYLKLLRGYSVKTCSPSSKNKQTKKAWEAVLLLKSQEGGFTMGGSQQCDEHSIRTPT